jgi:pyruvate dehydrogenase E2 component (dihydrolipoamide acetyltransferase)
MSNEHEVAVPNIGDFEEVDVVEVLVTPGTHVEVEQGLIVLESDKASMEIPSPVAGLVRHVRVKVGDKVSEGMPIVVVEADEGAPEAKPSPEPASAPAPAQTAPGTEVTPASPQQTQTGARAPLVGASLNDASASRTIPPPPEMPKEAPAESKAPAKPYASPAVRRFGRELGVDLSQVRGSGRLGRISKEDVQRYVKHAMSVAGTQTGAGFAVPELPEVDFRQFGEITIQPLTKIQRLSGRNLYRSWITIPHVTQHDEADITELEAFRKKMRAERPDAKLTMTSFFMKAVVVVLKQMPRFNASLDRTGENLIFKHYFHVGVAVDTPNGLVVPVIRDVDTKGLHELAAELSGVSERARARRLSPAELQGGSITVSSLGGIGGTAFTPIINPPEVAVLGVSRSRLQPAYVDGELVPRLICPISLSYDHRVIDGADAVRFTTRLRDVLGDIREMLL